jgi:hypothetical protein
MAHQITFSFLTSRFTSSHRVTFQNNVPQSPLTLLSELKVSQDQNHLLCHRQKLPTIWSSAELMPSYPHEQNGWHSILCLVEDLSIHENKIPRLRIYGANISTSQYTTIA